MHFKLYLLINAVKASAQAHVVDARNVFDVIDVS